MDSYIKELLELLDKKQQQLYEILRLTKEQAKAINEENIDELEQFLSKKQTHIDKIDAIDDDFTRIYSAFRQEYGLTDSDNKEYPQIGGFSELGSKVSKIAELIKDILKLEKSNNSKVKEIMKKYGDNIKNVNQTKKISNAYGNEPIEAQSYFFDKKK